VRGQTGKAAEMRAGENEPPFSQVDASTKTDFIDGGFRW